jgi:hypothetical protein
MLVQRKAHPVTKAEHPGRCSTLRLKRVAHFFSTGSFASTLLKIARKCPDAGDVWLWVAVDADSKLVPSWRLGQRDLATATDFVNDLMI